MKKIAYGYIFISLLLVVNLILYFSSGISLYGYWSDRILFWIWLIATAFLIISQWKKKAVKVYSLSLLILVGLSMIPMFVPFIAIVITGAGLDRTFGREFDNNLRIQVTRKSIMGRPNVEVIQRKGMFEQLIGELSGLDFMDDFHEIEELEGLKVIEERTASSLVEFRFPNDNVEYWLKKR